MPYFPKVSFVDSDNTLGSSDVSAALASNLGKNPLIQIPGIVAAIAVPFQPAANWNPKGVKATGGSSQVQLSTNTLCGIFTGKITVWNHPLITKDNAGVRLGTGKITVVYRHDSSGTTFLFSNALVNQCGTPSRRTKSQFPIPAQWLTDNAITAQSTSAKPYYKTGTSFFINVFTHGHLPANFYNDNGGASGVTGGVSGSGGIKTAILATTGSIGYVSPDFVQPVDTSGPAAANLQTYATFNAGSTPVYKAPTAANAIPIMAATKPPAFTGSPIPANNPLNWGVVNPLPTAATAYPIGGFSFIDLHRCYTSAADVAALVGKTAGSVGYLNWYYGTSSVNANAPANILKQDGFAPVPATWTAAINRLLTSPTLGIGVAGAAGSCKQIAHGA
jgi:ABC-type phosphate transport system substrate-binding protein